MKLLIDRAHITIVCLFTHVHPVILELLRIYRCTDNATARTPMKCPHCAIHFHENWEAATFRRDNDYLWEERLPLRSPRKWGYRSAQCPECKEITLEITRLNEYNIASEVWRLVYPIGANRGPVPQEIDLLLNETDPKKALPHRLRETVDGIRNFGNFSAHPIDDKTTLQVIDVEDHEAEWCLETIEELFEHFYVGPAMAKAKKAALDAKLAAAGKPPSKG